MLSSVEPDLQESFSQHTSVEEEESKFFHPRDVAYLTIKGINHRKDKRDNNRSTVTFIRKPSLMEAGYV